MILCIIRPIDTQTPSEHWYKTMKKKNFFMLALAAMAFAACSNEDLVPTDNPGGDNQLVTDRAGDAWVALAVKTSADSCIT